MSDLDRWLDYCLDNIRAEAYERGWKAGHAAVEPVGTLTINEYPSSKPLLSVDALLPEGEYLLIPKEADDE